MYFSPVCGDRGPRLVCCALSGILVVRFSHHGSNSHSRTSNIYIVVYSSQWWIQESPRRGRRWGLLQALSLGQKPKIWQNPPWIRQCSEIGFKFLSGMKLSPNNKVFQSKANRRLANRCVGYITIKFRQVWMEGQGKRSSQVNKFEHVHVWSHGDTLLWTD